MKDAYSFDADEVAAAKSYEIAKKAYMRIFRRLGLKFRAVEADTGSIGGNFSHEFMVLAETGEDTIVFCAECSFASNIERAGISHTCRPDMRVCPEPEKVPTPNAHTVDEVSTLLGLPSSSVVKTLIYLADGAPIAVLVRGDRELNEAKLRNFLDASEVALAPGGLVEELTKAPLGFAGPMNLDIPVYADNELMNGCDYVTGANSPDEHILHVSLDRDVKITAYADLRNIAPDDQCPRCGGSIDFKRGIEVGHIFMLGKKYSEPMGASFLGSGGRETPFVMGCYGIGISRIAAAAIEQNFDDDGILFPPSISPADCILINLDPKNPQVTETAENIYRLLEEKNVTVLYDDREERPGIKFKDADLLGMPIQLIIGRRGLERGVVEYKNRKTGEKGELKLATLGEEYLALVKKVAASWE